MFKLVQISFLLSIYLYSCALEFRKIHDIHNVFLFNTKSFYGHIYGMCLSLLLSVCRQILAVTLVSVDPCSWHSISVMSKSFWPLWWHCILTSTNVDVCFWSVFFGYGMFSARHLQLYPISVLFHIVPIHVQRYHFIIVVLHLTRNVHVNGHWWKDGNVFPSDCLWLSVVLYLLMKQLYMASM